MYPEQRRRRRRKKKKKKKRRRLLPASGMKERERERERERARPDQVLTSSRPHKKLYTYCSTVVKSDFLSISK